MDTRVLKYFLVVAETNNVTQAAHRLHLTQPTLSRQLRDLERELGRPLFDRDHHQLRLNAAGELFRQRATTILALLDHAAAELQDRPDQLAGVINLGVVETAVAPWLMDRLRRFQAAHPAVTFNVVDGDGDTLRAQLDQGTLDLAALVEPVEAARYDLIALPVKEEWGLIAKKGVLPAKTILKEALGDLPLIMGRRSIVRDQVAETIGLDPTQLKVRVTVNLPMATKQLALTGHYFHLGIRGVFDQFHDSRLTFIPLTPAVTSGHLLATKKHRSLSPAAAAFLTFLRTAARID